MHAKLLELCRSVRGPTGVTLLPFLWVKGVTPLLLHLREGVPAQGMSRSVPGLRSDSGCVSKPSTSSDGL